MYGAATRPLETMMFKGPRGKSMPTFPKTMPRIAPKIPSTCGASQCALAKEPEICSSKPKIQFDGTGVGVGSLKKEQVARKQNIHQITSDRKDSMFVKVEKGWCLPLQPPTCASAKMQPMQVRPMAPPKQPHSSHFRQGGKSGKTPPKATAKAWDLSSMFKMNKN